MNKITLNTIIKSSVIKGTIILTAAGFITRIIGFFFRIFLTGKIGAEGLGIYQLIFPVQIVCYSLCTIGFEISSALYCIFNIKKPFCKFFKYNFFCKKIKSISKEIFTLSLPLTLNKLMLSILQSIQSILIPSTLIIYGYTSSESLSIYGILLGLVLPLIMFPSAIVNSMSLLLLPTVSEAESNNNNSKIKYATEKAIYFSSIFGILCLGIFARYGNEIDALLFNSGSGGFISSLGLICPFIYITSTLSSTINGLGHTEITFRHNIVSTLIQILSIIILIPKLGINGYIFGLVASSVISSIFHYISTFRLIRFHINIRKAFLYPFMVVFLLIKSCDVIFINILKINNFSIFILSIIITCISYVIIYLKDMNLN